MNKLIKELANQAGREECSYGYWMSEYVLCGDRKIEDFAELIVQECVGICEEYSGTGWDEAAQRIAERIKERFGVE